MFEHKKIEKLDDFFLELGNRPEKSIYFYRINGFNHEIEQFINRYYQDARMTGVVLEKRIENPTEQQLSYYEEMMGLDFQLSTTFIDNGLKKWLPRMDNASRESVVNAIYYTLEGMKKSGKNDNVLKNAYIKFMCWFYYKFERIVSKLGNKDVPKVLYEGEISNYELMFMSVLSKAGCDIVLLQYNGDEKYLTLDQQSVFSNNLKLQNMQAFPQGFSIKLIRDNLQEAMNNERLYKQKPTVINCTNAWITGKGLEDVRQNIAFRGTEPQLFYNCFLRINGVEDKTTYINELYQFQLELKNNKRHVVIISEKIPHPTVEEISKVERRNYTNRDEMLMDLAKNIQYTANLELQKLMNKAFLDVMLEYSKISDINLNKLMNKAVYLLCWLKRYQGDLFQNWKCPEIGCFIYMGGCKDENEAMLMKFLSKLPIDVVIFNPNLNVKCCLADTMLYEINYNESLAVDKFPQENSDVHFGTVAYHAERELDTLMYQDTGMYRNQQYAKANSITLQTMYEEIKLMWNEELKYRPNFSTSDGTVTMPVIFAKVSGVKDGQVSKYWSEIKSIVTEDTYVVKNVPYIESTVQNPIKPHAAEFFKNGKVQRTKIKSHNTYQYGFLREEIQEYILDKLQVLIDQRLIKGTFENGMEYTTISTILNLPKDIIRLIQKFDFTKKNPKLIYINTTEKIISVEDSIMVAFLNLIGFDVVFFVPTGYQSVEKYFSKKVMEEYQIGEYMYDLHIPNLDNTIIKAHKAWLDRLFGPR